MANVPLTIVYALLTDVDMEKHPNYYNHRKTVLTEREVMEIRRRYATGSGASELSDDYHVARTTIYSIVNRKTHKGV